jgi:hypothetical protein
MRVLLWNHVFLVVFFQRLRPAVEAGRSNPSHTKAIHTEGSGGRGVVCQISDEVVESYSALKSLALYPHNLFKYMMLLCKYNHEMVFDR